jgi:hypothetical protein
MKAVLVGLLLRGIGSLRSLSRCSALTLPSTALL